MYFSRQLAVALLSGGALVTFAGCAAQRPPDLPQAASLKAEGSDRVVYTADESGTLYISDADQDIFWSGTVHSGDRVELDPTTNKLSVNGRVVSNRPVGRIDHKFYVLAGVTGNPMPARTDDLAVARPPAVPATAMLKGEGRDRLEYTADGDGTIWVTDANNGMIAYSGRIARGDRVLLNPTDHQLLLNGRAVSEKNLANDNFRIFYEPGMYVQTAVPAAGQVAPAVVVTPSAGPTVVTLPPPPTGATLWSTATERSSLTASADGTVWVVDGATNRTVFASRVVKSDVLVIDPASQLLTLNGKPAANIQAPAGRYQVFFQPTH
jgi:hypothetical protein